ncbi:uncharacterized protein LOC135350350 [Halichondria panicea]|uniref:uncharacterized protein LOC135350350 n=1 Tax=Halichondria panicea TaxID=6063 RepID=UPI00312B6E43
MTAVAMEFSTVEKFMVDQQVRRHSYPMRPPGELPESDHPKAIRSASLEPSPTIGIRLGSKVAKQAAKSFWNMDMLHESLQKIAQFAAIESSSLGSSIQSVDEEQEDPLVSSTEECMCFSPIAPHLMYLPFSLTSRSAPSTPTQSPLLALKRPKSACTERKMERKDSTIPRKITPASLTPRTAAKVRFHLSGSQLSLQGEQEHNPYDDGFYEP